MPQLPRRHQSGAWALTRPCIEAVTGHDIDTAVATPTNRSY